MTNTNNKAVSPAVENLSPAMQKRVNALSTLHTIMKDFLLYVKSDPDMWARLKELFTPGGKERNLVAIAQHFPRLTVKEIEKIAREIKENALKANLAQEKDGEIIPLDKVKVNNTAVALTADKNIDTKKDIEPQKEPKKTPVKKDNKKPQAAQAKADPPPPPKPAVELPEIVILPDQQDGKDLVLHRQDNINNIEDLERLIDEYNEDDSSVCLGARWTASDIKANYMRFHKKPAPINFPDDLDLYDILHITRVIDETDKHKYREIILLSIYTDSVSHLPVSFITKSESKKYHTAPATGIDNFNVHFSVYAGKLEEPQAAEPPKEEPQKKKAPPKKK